MNKIKNAIGKVNRLIKIIFKSKKYDKKFFVFGTPIHGNLGDHAIIYAAQKFLEGNFENYKVIEVDSFLVKWFIGVFKRIIKKDDLIFINGGGFMGSLWLNEEGMVRTVITSFKDNKVIVLPQTIYFSDDESGKEALEDSRKSYNSNKNLVICCREKFSYDFMKKEFPNLNIMLVPDMVLYLDVNDKKLERNNALFCIRRDKEKVNYDFDKIKTYLAEKYKFNIDYTDTVVENKIYSKQRENDLNNKLEEFSKYKIIVTDRLHGMVFAYLTHTPCLVFENKSYKVKGLYEWIRKVNYMHLCSNDFNDFEIIDRLINDEKCIVDSLKNEFSSLKREINDFINKKGE